MHKLWRRFQCWLGYHRMNVTTHPLYTTTVCRDCGFGRLVGHARMSQKVSR